MEEYQPTSTAVKRSRKNWVPNLQNAFVMNTEIPQNKNIELLSNNSLLEDRDQMTHRPIETNARLCLMHSIKKNSISNEENPIVKSLSLKQNGSTSTVKKDNSNWYQFYVNSNQRNLNEYHFKDNRVNTTKYNIVTFLPKALLFQFMRLANVYFLICAIIQCIPIISPWSPWTAVIPIVFVLSVSWIREAIEDWSRAKLDKEQNSEPAEVYRDGRWEDVESGNWKIGEIVEVKQDGTFPADLVLLDSEWPEGICYIETGTLDGEKTLKLKSSPFQTAGKFNINEKKSENFLCEGHLICDSPNPELYQLNGKLNINFKIIDTHSKQTNMLDIINNGWESHNFPWDAKQLWLKGGKLRNTRWIIGIVIYTGHNCKLMKNAKNPRLKYSSVESWMNKSLVIILIIQSILCILCAILRGPYYTSNLEKNSWIAFTENSYGLESFLSYFTYIWLLNTMIPISLIITLEIVKLLQGWLMSIDVEGYSKINYRYIKPNSVSLNEEWGLVNYIFTDKTGTLTCNKMMFKYCVIGDVCYQFLRGWDSERTDKEIKFRDNEGIIPFECSQMFNTLKISDSKLNASTYPGFKIVSSGDSSVSINMENSLKLIEEFWQALALCHDCSIQKQDDGTEEYIGMSPDSIELVKTAKMQGFNLVESGVSSIKRLMWGNGSLQKDFERWQLIEFTSDRKRETIIVKDGSMYKLYIKGADSIIEERLSSNTRPEIWKQCKYYVNKFSAQGYRTLFIGMKVLSQKEYQAFADELNDANWDWDRKEEKVAKAYSSIEKDIYLIGTTIVEDKLQEKVPETIRDLRLAGIKIWMLTGDKMNTAYNIGWSCNLINSEWKTFHIEGVEIKKNEKLEIVNNEERSQIIINFAKNFNKFKGEFPSLVKPQFGILVDEKALLTINEDEEIQKIFLDIAKDAAAVICCRVSPLQKSQVVKMMKAFEPKMITWAIGDGGNDVSMIMEAHIGVGIYGEEGMKAVQSGDYAIGEFKILHRWLLFHGRTNYIRNSEVVLYFFYKNFVFTLVQFWYGFYSNFSGQTIIDDWFITLFNWWFTSLPLGARACLDFDVKPCDGKVISKMLPFWYEETRSTQIFTKTNFSMKLAKGTVHCWINYYWVVYTLDSIICDQSGNQADIWFISVNWFTNILVIVSINLFVYTRYHTWINALIMLIISFLAFGVFLIIVHYFTIFNSVGTMGIAFGSPVLWWNIVFICGVCYWIDLSLRSFEFIILKTISRTWERLVRERGTINIINNWPDIIMEQWMKFKQYGENIEEWDTINCAQEFTETKKIMIEGKSNEMSLGKKSNDKNNSCRKNINVNVVVNIINPNDNWDGSNSLCMNYQNMNNNNEILICDTNQILKIGSSGKKNGKIKTKNELVVPET